MPAAPSPRSAAVRPGRSTLTSGWWAGGWPWDPATTATAPSSRSTRWSMPSRASSPPSRTDLALSAPLHSGHGDDGGRQPHRPRLDLARGRGCHGAGTRLARLDPLASGADRSPADAGGQHRLAARGLRGAGVGLATLILGDRSEGEDGPGRRTERQRRRRARWRVVFAVPALLVCVLVVG